MSAASLESALRERGIACRVEERERLALLVPDGPIALLEDAAARREAVALVRAHGFTHIALEIADEPAGNAAVHRD